MRRHLTRVIPLTLCLCACDLPVGGDGGSGDAALQTGAGLPEGCGDGVREDSEQCDDGNRRAGDGCSAECLVEVEDALPCGTYSRRTNALSMRDPFCDEPINRDAAISQEPLTLRLRVHVVSDGRPAASAQAVSSMVDLMNQFFEGTGIQVDFGGPDAIDLIEDGRYLRLDDALFEELMVINNDREALDLYIVNEYPGLCGRAYDIGPSPVSDGVAVVSDCIGDNTAAHELGHILGLWHTHTALLPGANCDTSYDLCCDTPFDPGVGVCNRASCDPLCVDGSMPDTTNIMSYYNCAEDPAQGHFSAQQNGRMRCYLDRFFQYAIERREPPPEPEPEPAAPTVAVDRARVVRAREVVLQTGRGFTPFSLAECVSNAPSARFTIPQPIDEHGEFILAYAPRAESALGRYDLSCVDEVTRRASNRVFFEVVEPDDCRPITTFDRGNLDISAPAGCDLYVNGVLFWDPLPGRPYARQNLPAAQQNRRISLPIPEHLALFLPMTNHGCNVDVVGSCHWLTGPSRDNAIFLSGGISECQAPTGYGLLIPNHELAYPRCR